MNGVIAHDCFTVWFRAAHDKYQGEDWRRSPSHAVNITPVPQSRRSRRPCKPQSSRTTSKFQLEHQLEYPGNQGRNLHDTVLLAMVRRFRTLALGKLVRKSRTDNNEDRQDHHDILYYLFTTRDQHVRRSHNLALRSFPSP